MSTEWQRKIGVGERQVRYGIHAGTVKHTRVLREDGKLSGVQSEHWSGRVDARIIPPTIYPQTRTNEANQT